MLTPQERQLVEFGKENNQSKDQIMQALQSFRGVGATTAQPTETITGTRSGLKEVGTGVVKGALETAQGLGQLGLRAAEVVTRREKGAFGSQETFFQEPEALKAKTTGEKIGKFGERVAEFAVPLTKVGKAVEGSNFLVRLASKAVTAGGVATAQAGEVGKETAIAGGIEGALPIAGKVARPVFNVIRRLFKGLGSGLSGVSTDVIDLIVENPQKALEVSRQLETSGNFTVLEENARIIVNGVSKIRQDARRAFGEGLNKLKSEDINPTTFRDSIQGFLDSVGSSVKGKFRELKNVEFEDPKNIQKASNLIEELSTTKLDGFSLRKLLEKVSNSRFKTATTDERLSFNVFIKEYEDAIKKAISGSTNKLDEINAAFSKDIQLTEGIERIFGKIKFKNLSEVDRVAQKLEQLFSQKGLNPREIDEFLTKLGIIPEDFRTSEGVRQVTSKITGANTRGLTITELIQSVTSSILTPEAIKNISIATGIAEDVLGPLLQSLSPTARGILIQSLIEK